MATKREQQAFRKDFFLEECRKFIGEMRRVADGLERDLDSAIAKGFAPTEYIQPRLDLAAGFADAGSRIMRNSRIDLIITYAAQSVALDNGYDDILKGDSDDR